MNFYLITDFYLSAIEPDLIVAKRDLRIGISQFFTSRPQTFDGPE